ncbi:hypothetical protein [Arthrobacter sp. NicSoilB8]|uniref:hypothetical protein n=1 Tax=Arthrobacter sp. NicSoilB8 TaxID=2830998 RepID=UPI003208EF68
MRTNDQYAALALGATVTHPGVGVEEAGGAVQGDGGFPGPRFPVPGPRTAVDVEGTAGWRADGDCLLEAP